MPRSLVSLAVALIVALSVFTISRPTHVSASIPWSVGYYTGWENYPISQIPWSDFTAMIACCAATQTDGGLDFSATSLTPDEMTGLVAAGHAHGKKVLYSIGGSGDGNWNSACSPSIRSTFVSNIVAVIKRYGFDGVDLDIERDWGYPDYVDYTFCVSAIQSAVKSLNPSLLVTEAADPDTQPLMIAKVWKYLDVVDIMSYSSGASDIARWVNSYTSRGVPAGLLAVGLGTNPDEYDYAHPSDCGDKAQYAAHHGLRGLMEWTVDSEAAPCLSYLAPYVSGGTPLPTSTPSSPAGTSTPAPASTAAPTATPTSTATSAPLVLYDGKVENATDNSYSFSARNRCDATTFSAPPCSYSITYRGWRALDFWFQSAALDASPYKTLQFDVNTNGQPLSDFFVAASNVSGGGTGSVRLSDAVVSSVAGGCTARSTGAWVHISIPMSSLDPSNEALKTIQLKNYLNQPLSPVWYDAIKLAG